MGRRHIHLCHWDNGAHGNQKDRYRRIHDWAEHDRYHRWHMGQTGMCPLAHNADLKRKGQRRTKTIRKVSIYEFNTLLKEWAFMLLKINFKTQPGSQRDKQRWEVRERSDLSIDGGTGICTGRWRGVSISLHWCKGCWESRWSFSGSHSAGLWTLEDTHSWGSQVRRPHSRCILLHSDNIPHSMGHCADSNRLRNQEHTWNTETVRHYSGSVWVMQHNRIHSVLLRMHSVKILLKNLASSR